MTEPEILSQLNEVFRDVLENEGIQINMNTQANDIEEWDSLSHIVLVVSIEKRFKIRFKSKEILSWKNIGEMANTIFKKIN